MAALQADAQLVALIDGVTIRETLVDEETIRWLDERGLHVLVWTANDLD